MKDAYIQYKLQDQITTFKVDFSEYETQIIPGITIKEEEFIPVNRMRIHYFFADIENGTRQFNQNAKIEIRITKGKQ